MPILSNKKPISLLLKRTTMEENNHNLPKTKINSIKKVFNLINQILTPINPLKGCLQTIRTSKIKNLLSLK